MIYDDMVVFGPDLGQVIGGCGTGNSQQHRGRKHNKRVVVKLTPQINRSQRCLEHPTTATAELCTAFRCATASAAIVHLATCAIHRIF